ncbi:MULTISPECIES: glycosyltransferase [Prochlorococcus]|uniref:Glycosyltransferase n=1 Tax=Prochlorococcus marinus (strain SARG / CCMP1375 / SS120) TaxID=167539 RepID=Q7VEF3_PROMA|nr:MULTISPECIES: glycosyltransferase [Prochlorococcus]AAP99106.1 Glycosyltransferase [Prochlorococcus marinus subsp. marinus str. CCMP1375]KGG11634.1 Glycosyltransferase [Prochlorococcus marinus str. LG]KGG22358.1 Glycosyltransferase [Prochlorococcus marinus str. SS2]KGG22694.1 Glycosyltransferase [Prochlorococcus marinus str. SS35]KGG32885.1 Glycosyltransferase [Prochlorococcus marinus str. SS51]
MESTHNKLHYRNLNKTYYQDLEKIHQVLIPEGQRILELGCGVGDLLSSLKPSYGVGIEIDLETANIARERHKHLHIYNLDAEGITQTNFNTSEPFDIIIINNTLNTINDVQALFVKLEEFSHCQTRLVISFHNWLWQPLLKLSEKVGQREPQPPESWLTPGDISNLLDISGWEVLKHGHRCLVPRNIPVISSFANRWLSQLPLLENFDLTHWMIARRRPKEHKEASISIVIPARNESGNISSAIKRMPDFGLPTEVIFVEGHSNDDTWEEINRVCADYEGPLAIEKYRQTGKGKADAVWLAFEKAKGDILMILDADLTVRPEDLPVFVRTLLEGNGEFVNGCRLVYPRTNLAMPLLNTLANRFFAAVFSWLLRQRFKDTLCGTKVLWKKDYQRLKDGRSYFGDFDPFGDFDLLFGASKLNLKIVEVPVRYQERIYGSSNISHFKEGLVLAKMCFIAAKKLRFIP